MANTRSALKQMREGRKRNLRNRMIQSRMRTYVKAADAAIVTGGVTEAQEALQEALSQIDRTAQKGVIHRNSAARRKSRLAKRFNALLQK
ncbi:MAG: 30S ribosomal protein S20 [Chloroflexota bacterium]